MAGATDHYEPVKVYDDEEKFNPALCKRCSAARSDAGLPSFRVLVTVTVLYTLWICGATYIGCSFLLPKYGFHGAQKGYSTEWGAKYFSPNGQRLTLSQIY